MKPPWNTPLAPNIPKFPSAREYLDKYAEEHMPAPGKEIADLTNDEKMALCIKAGVPLQALPDMVVTSVQVGYLTQPDGSYRVIQDDPQRNRGQVIYFKPKKPA